MKKLFEAELKNNSGLPDNYFRKLVERGRALYGHGPTFNDQREFQNTFFALLAVQNGHEEELTEIGKDIIMKHYGNILDNVILDIKVIKPGDPKQIEMAENTAKPPKVEYEDITHLRDEIDKRKMLNVLMQGESQNVHDLLYFEKDRLDYIDPNLLRLDLALIKKDILLHWNDDLDLQASMEQMYQFANVMEIDAQNNPQKEKPKPDEGNLKQTPYKPGKEDEDEEEGETAKNVIRVRALMLSGLVHETVKGIYELIATVQQDAVEGDTEEEKIENIEKIMQQTDNLENEQEDIQFGSFVASDVRDFVNKILDTIPGTDKISNMKEFVFGHLAAMPAKEL